MTGQLGTSESKLGHIKLGTVDETGVVSLEVEASNTLSLTQVVGLNKELQLSVSNTLTLGDQPNRVFEESIESTVTYTDEALYNYGKFADAISSIDFDQLAAVEKVILRTITSTLIISHAVQRNLVRAINVTSTFGASHSLFTTNTKSASNDLTFSQTADYFVSKVGSNTLSFTQAVLLNTVLTRTLNSLFGVFQTIQLGPNTFRRSLTSTLNFTQVATGVDVRGVTHTLTFIQTVTVNNVRGGESIFELADQATVQINYTRSITNALLISQFVEVKRVKSLSATSIFAPEHSTHKQKILTHTVSSIFGVVHELVKSRYIESLTDTITFDQLVTHERTVERPNNNAMAFQQSVVLNKVLNLSASNVLVFKAAFDKHVGIGNVPTIPIPPAQVVKVKNLVILRGPGAAITLPAPEFDDTDAFTGAINIIRFKTGGKVVYKNDTERRVLDYTFVIERFKYLELKNFINAYNATPFYLQNWKGEMWYVLFNGNPFVFTEESRWESNPITGPNKFTIPLSFEGVRIA